MPDFESFVKALKDYFYEGNTTAMVPEFKQLTEKDKVELSQMLNDAGFTHPQYVAK